MALLADTAGAVIGVDTHAGTHTACLADRLGRQLAVITIAADPGGCRRLLAWARRHAPGPRLAWPVEGTRSHGLGLTRYLHAHGQLVTEAGGQNAPAGGRAVRLTRLMRPGPRAMPCRPNGWPSREPMAPGRRCGSCSPPGPRRARRAPPR